MIKEAVILAGGIGSRLSSVVYDRPKSLAPVGGRPFLAYLIAWLKKQGIQRLIFSLGYKHEMILEFLTFFPKLDYETVVESEPLGTGGGIRLACSKVQTRDVLICNGDTFFDVNIAELAAFHNFVRADCSLALKPMTDFDRYGSVELNAESQVVLFNEKQFRPTGLINGGIYILKPESLLNQPLTAKFSFEKEYLEKYAGPQGNIYGSIQDGFFIDIGVPDDYHRAQTEASLMSLVDN